MSVVLEFASMWIVEYRVKSSCSTQTLMFGKFVFSLNLVS